MLFYACNDFATIRDLSTLKAFTKQIRKANASALRSVTIKAFGLVSVNLSAPAKPHYNTRHYLRWFGQLAKHYGWTSAKAEVMFERLSQVGPMDFMFVTFNVGDLGQPWDEFISEME